MGNYVKDSLDWYQTKYLLIIQERSCMYLLACSCILMLIVLSINLYSMLPLNHKVRALIITQDTLSLKSDRTHITDSDPYRGVAMFLAENYLSIRESYDKKNIENSQAFIRNQSSGVVFNKFLKFMSINNPASPLLRYDNNVRSIEILETDVIDNKKAHITFRAVLRGKGSDGKINILEDVRAQALVVFNMNKLKKGFYSKNKFQFIVEDYQVKITNNNLKQKS